MLTAIIDWIAVSMPALLILVAVVWSVMSVSNFIWGKDDNDDPLEPW